MEAGISVPDTNIYIKKYTNHSIILNQSSHTKSIVISPQKLIYDNWPHNSIKSFKKETLMDLFKQQADVYLIGTGQEQSFPSTDIYQFCIENYKAVDFMNSQAACRTFNMLASEGRSIIAAIIL